MFIGLIVASSKAHPQLLDESELKLVTQEMSSKQKMWADAYIAHGHNARMACKSAGYRSLPGVIQNNMLEHPMVGRYIRHRVAQQALQYEHIRHELIAYLLRALRLNVVEFDLDDPKDYQRFINHAGDLVDQYRETPMGVELKLIGKAKVISLLCQMLGITQAEKGTTINNLVSVGGNGIDWDQMRQPVEDEGDVFDEVIEGHLESGNGSE